MEPPQNTPNIKAVTPPEILLELETIRKGSESSKNCKKEWKELEEDKTSQENLQNQKKKHGIEISKEEPDEINELLKAISHRLKEDQRDT